MAPGIFRNNLPFADPGKIDAIECTVTIVETRLDTVVNSKNFARPNENHPLYRRTWLEALRWTMPKISLVLQFFHILFDKKHFPILI